MRQLFPPVAPEAPNFQPQNKGVETNLTQEAEIETVETEPVEAKSVGTNPVETKLIDSVTLHFPFARETRVNNPHSILYAALPPISRPTQPAPTTETEAPTIVRSAGSM